MLTAHLTTSVGWLGAVATFLVLAGTALSTTDSHIADAADLLMDVVAWWVLVPFCLSSFLTGILSALGTPWGLLQHYWVFFASGAFHLIEAFDGVRNRKAFVMTETELKAIAALAIIGLKTTPNQG